MTTTPFLFTCRGKSYFTWQCTLVCLPTSVYWDKKGIKPGWESNKLFFLFQFSQTVHTLQLRQPNLKIINLICSPKPCTQKKMDHRHDSVVAISTVWKILTRVERSIHLLRKSQYTCKTSGIYFCLDQSALIKWGCQMCLSSLTVEISHVTMN